MLLRRAMISQAKPQGQATRVPRLCYIAFVMRFSTQRQRENVFAIAFSYCPIYCPFFDQNTGKSIDSMDGRDSIVSA